MLLNKALELNNLAHTQTSYCKKLLEDPRTMLLKAIIFILNHLLQLATYLKMLSDAIADTIIGRSFNSKQELLAFQEEFKFSRYEAHLFKNNDPQELQNLGFKDLKLRCRSFGTYKPRGEKVCRSHKLGCKFQLHITADIKLLRLTV